MLYNTSAARRIRAHIAMCADPVSRFRRILGECGYVNYPVHPNRKIKGGRNQMLVFDKRRPNNPLLVYERSHGKLVVRPWSGPDQFITLRNRIAEKGVKNINLVLGGNMNSRSRTERPWSDWLTDAQKRELRDIGVDV